MKCIILAGGSGDRLWPLSRKNFPKQFLNLDGGNSLFQDTVTRNIPYCDKFYIVTNDEVIEKLRHVSRFSNMNASCAIIVCGDLEKALPKEMASFWIQDCSAAMENLLLAAEGCGLGACWIGVYPQKRVVERMKDILDITNDKIIPLGMVWIGYKAEEKKATCYYDDACVHYIK